MLATAVHVARRNGLPDPIPVTLRYPGIDQTEESQWQELVVRHLAIDEWIRVEIHDELDFLGPIAQQVMRDHGLLWPTNVHTLIPIARLARGGTVLTGWEGDGLLGSWRWRNEADAIAGRSTRNVHEVLRFAYANGPTAVRRRRMKKKGPLLPTPWLQASAEREVALRWLEQDAAEPGLWAARVRWWSRRRYLALARRSINMIGPDHDVVFGHPLLDPSFLSALASMSPVSGLGTRTRAMQMLFGDLLPTEIIGRQTKATFRDAFWGRRTRDFARRWSGEGVDTSIVNVERLKDTWHQEPPNTRSVPLLQSIWLRNFNDAEQPVEDR